MNGIIEWLKWWEWSNEECSRVIALCAIIGVSWAIKPIKGFIKKLWNNISLYFERFIFLFSDEFWSSVKVAKRLYDLDDCHIVINKDVIGDTDDKDYFISPMQLTIICNVIENEIENYCHCCNQLYNSKNYYDYLHYIRTGKNKNDTLDERRISALKNALNLCKDDLSFSYMSEKLDKAGLPWTIHNINNKQKWNI